jgi:hypothetical protein
LRIRPASDQGTPYPPEIPKGENPPNGALIDYYLKDASATPVTLEILDSKGTVIRRYASSDKAPVVDEKTLDIPMFWVRPPQILSDKAGMHRFIWDLHYAALNAGGSQRGAGRRGGGGPWAPPGQYSARLTVNGKRYSQPLLVKMDPRVNVSDGDLQLQLAVSQRAASAQAEVARAAAQAAAITKQVKDLQLKSKGDAVTTAAIEKFNQRLGDVAGRGSDPFGAVETVDTDETSLRHLATVFGQINSAVQSASAAPTPEQQQALDENSKVLQSTLAQWKQIVADELPKLNAQLKEAKLAEITTTASGASVQ